MFSLKTLKALQKLTTPFLSSTPPPSKKSFNPPICKIVEIFLLPSPTSKGGGRNYAASANLSNACSKSTLVAYSFNFQTFLYLWYLYLFLLYLWFLFTGWSPGNVQDWHQPYLAQNLDHRLQPCKHKCD